MQTTDKAINEIGGSISETVSEMQSSGNNVFQTIANAIGLDLSSLSLSRIILSVVLLIILIVISKIIGAVAARMLCKTKMGEGLKKFIANIVRFVMYFLSIIIFADSIGIPVTSLIAVFSLLGLAVSLSIQNLLGNIMSGVSLLMLKPFDIGDYIETDVGGTVKNIGLFYTEIVTVDNKKVFIPNEKIMAEKLTNYNAETTRRIDVSFNAAYSCDIETVKQALHDAVNSVDMLLKEPEPIIGIAEYGDSAIIYDVRVWTKTSDFFPAKYELMDAVSESYKKYGVVMAYNRLEVEIVKY